MSEVDKLKIKLDSVGMFLDVINKHLAEEKCIHDINIIYEEAREAANK